MRYLITIILSIMLLCLNAAADTCNAIAALPLAHTAITMTKIVPAGFEREDSQSFSDLPAFCRVTATLTPSSDSNIHIEVWMPVSGWNGKYEGTGTGGYAGSIAYGELADGIHHGYAVANADMGTSPATGFNGDALIGHPERWVDWGWRSTHEMTIAAKQIIHAYYGREPKYSYFTGCSTGGEQALMEAQRFPDDYDGIVAGAPANDRTNLHMAILWNYAVAERNRADYIPAEKLQAITRAVLHSCRVEKAVNSDTFLSNPSDCHWDPQTILCKTVDAPNCLMAQQVTTARKIYSGPQNPATHASIYPGLPRGTEYGWESLMPKTGGPPYDSLFKWVFGPAWNWRSFDFDRDVTAVNAELASKLNATNPDLAVFQANGHKLIVYHGWADWLIAPQGSINYYKSVMHAQSKAAADNGRSAAEETQGFYRLFMVPGMAHCGGGPGLNTVNMLPSLELWVEKGVAPQKLIAKRIAAGITEMTRPICAYPQAAHYRGTGDRNDAANFSCIGPSDKTRR